VINSEEIKEIIEEQIKEKGFELYALEIKKEGKDWIMKIFVDNNNRSISLDECAFVSNYISDFLDNQSVFSELPSYHLEVSSPGLDRLLKSDFDYQWAKDKTLKVKFTNEQKKKEAIEGKLSSFNDEFIELTLEKNKKISINRSDIESARRAMIFSELVGKKKD